VCAWEGVLVMSELTVMVAWGKKLRFSLSVLAALLRRRYTLGECSANCANPGESSANCVFSRTHYPLQSPLVLRGAAAEPGSDASCQDDLHHTSVEGLKDPPGEFPQLPEVVEALLRLPHQSVNICSPSQILCDVDSQKPVAAHLLHNQLLSFGDIQHEAVTGDRLTTSSQEAFSSLPDIRPTTTVSSTHLRS